MVSFFSKKKERKVKNAILRGVYEDNLRIIKKQPPHIVSRNRSYFFEKIVLAFFIILLIVLVNGNYVNLSWVQEGQMTASLISQNFSVQPVDNTVEPLEYKPFLNRPDTSLSHVFGLGIKTIMIDPGHGGTDTGAIGKMGTKEKDIVLDIAKRLRERLRKRNVYNIIITREEDITLPLKGRIELARSKKADLFVSIHLNYLPSKPINIIETYYFGLPSDAKTLKLAEKENAGSEYRLSDFQEIVWKMSDKLKLQESQKLATSIQKNLYVNSKKDGRNIHNFGVKMAPFVVLLGIDVPSVLVEVSCLSNRDEEAKLNTEDHRENIARYIESGILDYLNKGEISHGSKKHSGRG